MSDADLDALARRYFELWQTQLSALATDRELSGSLARLLAAANAQVGAPFGGRDGRTQATETGTAPASPASGNGSVDLRQLGERLAALEQRLERLERAAKPAPRPRKPRARKAGKTG